VIVELAIMLGALVVGTAIAGALGAANLGIALSFGTMAFVIAVVAVMLRRP
jgi:hypothetical protein